MNRAQSLTYVPCGLGWHWMIALLLGARVKARKVAPNARTGTPNLRSAESLALWQAITDATEPLTKAAWLDRAGLQGKTQRNCGSSAIVNLVHGGWVREDQGFFSKG